MAHRRTENAPLCGWGVYHGFCFWQEDNEVNNTEEPSVLNGDIWEFTTQDYFVVDDFESYTDTSMAGTWLDAWEAINGVLGGSGIQPAVDGQVVHSGTQSMLLEFDNSTSPFFVEVVRTISDRKDWTKNAVTKMVLSFHGDLGNDSDDKLYVKLNGKRIDCNADLTTPWWQQWTIEINSSLGIDRHNIRQLRIGVGDVTKPDGKKGKVYIDDVRLYRATPSTNNLLNAIDALNTTGDLAGQLDTLVTMVMAANPAIVTALSSEEVYTVFLPSDDAFAALGLNADNVLSYLDEAALTDLVLYHLTSGSLTAEDIQAAEQLEMTDGNIVLQSDGLLIDATGRSAMIVASDTGATNGVIHVVDSVLAPFELRSIAALMADLNATHDLAGQFEAMLANPDVLVKLSDRGAQYTVLVPTSEATLLAQAQIDQVDNAYVREIIDRLQGISQRCGLLLKRAFLSSAFTECPSPQDWIASLKWTRRSAGRRARAGRDVGRQNRRIDVLCTECGGSFSIRQSKHEELIAREKTVLCRDCLGRQLDKASTARARRRRDYPLVSCEHCQEAFPLSRRKLDALRRRGRPILCSACLGTQLKRWDDERAEYDRVFPRITCPTCGRTFRVRKEKLEHLRSQGKAILCRDCLGRSRDGRVTEGNEPSEHRPAHPTGLWALIRRILYGGRI